MTLGGNQTFSSVVVIMEVRVGIGEELVAAAVKQPCKTISMVISWLLNVGAQCLGVFFWDALETVPPSISGDEPLSGG